MDQQLSVARMQIVQLTTEVQSSKQAAQHHEEKTAALQAQVPPSLLHACFTATQNATVTSNHLASTSHATQHDVVVFPHACSVAGMGRCVAVAA